MAQTVKITPATGLLEFIGDNIANKPVLQHDNAGNLTLTLQSAKKFIIGGNLKVNGKVTMAQQALVDGAAITWNFNSGANATVTLGGARTLVISNMETGDTGLILVKQDGVGGKTLTLPSGSSIVGGGTYTASPSAGATDVLGVYYDGTTYWWTIGYNTVTPPLTSVGITGGDFLIANSPLTANGNIDLALATVNSNVGQFGSATAVPVITVNGKGLITAVSTTAISIPTNLDSLTDVTISLPATGQLLQFNGAGQWINWTPNYLTGITSIQVTNALGYTPVPNTRTLAINGVSYDLTANRAWTIDTVAYTARLQHIVKAGVAINKGQAVYVIGADGTNMVVDLASNVSDPASSKTMGLLDATVPLNGFANVITEGLLEGIDTTDGQEGDPVWLGEDGNLIYGLANKPYAPRHLVFIGIVTRRNQNNGEIFVHIQNGFEIEELHNVDLMTTVPVNGNILGYNGTLWVNKTIAGWLGYTPANDATVVHTTGNESIAGIKTFSGTTQATSTTTGTLITSGGAGIAKNLYVGGDLNVVGNLIIGGTTTTVYAQNLSVSDNMIYLNNGILTHITNVVGNGSSVVYTTQETHNYVIGMSVTISGVNPTSYNLSNQIITGVSTNSFTIANGATGSYISGGTARAKTNANPDLGWAAGYNNGAYAHAGLFRDATDEVFKFFKGYTLEPDASPFIDTSHASFAYADLRANDITGRSFIKVGGAANEFLKADGSIDSSAYITAAALTAYQPLDADLTAIASLVTTGFLKRTGTDTWTLDSNTYLTQYIETDTLSSVTARGSLTNTPVTFNGNVTLGNNADLVFTDLAGSFPTTGKGFDWTLNNDGARIYAIQPSSDSIDLVFQLRDNATTNDRFVFWVDDYQGPAFDKYPLIIRGGTEFDLVSSALYTNGTLRLSNTGVLQNVTGNISMFTNDSGYITSASLSGYVPTSRTLTINGTAYDLSVDRSWTINSMVYPGAGIPVSTGTAWGTSIIDNSTNWNTAYSKRPTSIAFSGSGTKTLTLTQGDGSTLTASFSDIDAQTLSLSGSTLSISGGNSITLPSGGISQGTADDLYVNVSGDIMTGSLYVLPISDNPAQFQVAGTNPELYVSAKTGTARAFINRASTTNQATLHFTTTMNLFQGGAWDYTGMPMWTLGMTNNNNADSFKLAYGDIYDPASVALEITSARVAYFTNVPYAAGNLLATQSWVQSQGYITGESDTLQSVTSRGSSTNTDITIGGAGGDRGLRINHGSGALDYGRIRFYQDSTNISTIHSFSTAWQSGNVLVSGGAVNITGNTGVTFGSWNVPDAVFRLGGNTYFRNSVSIGVATAEAKLHVASGVGETGFLSRGSSGDTWFPYSNGQNYVRGVTNFDLGSTYFTGGNVSIGTTYNGFSLNVNGTTYIIGGQLYLNVDYKVQNTSDNASIQFSNDVLNIKGSMVPLVNGAQNLGSANLHWGTVYSGDLNAKGLLIGGLGAATTGGTLDWNHSSNARAGQGYTLLSGSHTNGPGPSEYFHPVGFEYSTKDGSGNVTQLAISYGSPGNKMYMRGRYSGSWTGWTQFITSNNIGSQSVNYASSADTAVNLYGPGASTIRSSSIGTSYNANYQIRENDGGYSNQDENYAPQLAFHWGDVVASSILMEATGRISIRNNPGTDYENFIAAVVYSSGYGDSTQWNTAYGWGNHASAGYLTSYTETDTLNTVTGRGNTTANSVRFGAHVDIDSSGSAFRFYNGVTFRGGVGLDDWAHGGSAANMTIYVEGNNTLFFSTWGTKRASLSSSAFNSLVSLQQNGNQVWHAGNDGSGSGLDADLLDGHNSSTFGTANTIALRDSSGNLYANYILGTYANFSQGNSENPTIGQIWTQNTSDNYLRKSTPGHFRSQVIDGYYIKLDTDTTTSGRLTLTYNDNNEPYSPLELRGNGTHTGLYINPLASAQAHVRFATDGTLKWQIRAPFQDGIDASLKIYSWNTADDVFVFDHDGTLTVSNRLIELSSIRYKTNVESLTPALDKVLQLRPVYYTKLNGTGETEIGLIAEEVAEIYPELIKYNNDGQVDGINYTRIAPILIKTIQEQQELIKKLSKRIDNLENR